MAHGDNPADRYNHRTARERDREKPTPPLPDAVRGVTVDSTEMRAGDGDTHFDAADEQSNRIRNVRDEHDDRAGAGGAPDGGPGSPGNTLGTGGSRREQDR